MWAYENKSRRTAYGKKFSLIVIVFMIAPLVIFPTGSAISWEQEIEISSDSNQNEPQRDSAIAVENGKVYTVWSQDDGKKYNIYFRENNSISWLAEVPLVVDMNIDQRNPDIAVENGVVHVVWHDQAWGGWDIAYIKRVGGTWGSIEKISVDIGSEVQWYPKIAASGGNVYVVWQDGRDGDWDIFFTYYNGVSWSTPLPINTDAGTEDQTNPRIDAGGGKVYVVWEEDMGSGNTDIKLRVFDGSSWGSIMTVSQDPPNEAQLEPDVAFDGGVVHVVWQQINVSDRDIFYRSWNGISFSTIQTLNKDIGTEFQKVPAITAQFGKVYVVWADARDGGNDWDIMCRQYNGSKWLEPEEISHDVGTEFQNNPEIDTENGTIHVVWEKYDPVNLDTEIFYIRGFEALPPDTFPPLVTDDLIDGVPVCTIPLGTASVILTATIDDSDTGGSNIGGANYTMGQANWPSSTDMIPDDPPLNTSIEGFHATIDTSSLAVGTYEIWVYGWDNKSNENIIGSYAILIVVYPIYLQEGWNLVSFPQIVSDTGRESVLDSIYLEYDTLWYYNTSDTNDFWKVYNIYKPLNMNDLGNLNNKMGFWIHINAMGGTTLLINGTLPSAPQKIPLYPGWNLVGYPSLTKRDRTAGLNNLTFGTHVDHIWTYNATTVHWEEIDGADYFEAGRGYWIHAIEKCEWIVDI